MLLLQQLGEAALINVFFSDVENESHGRELTCLSSHSLKHGSIGTWTPIFWVQSSFLRTNLHMLLLLQPRSLCHWNKAKRLINNQSYSGGTVPFWRWILAWGSVYTISLKKSMTAFYSPSNLVNKHFLEEKQLKWDNVESSQHRASHLVSTSVIAKFKICTLPASAAIFHTTLPPVALVCFKFLQHP